MITTGDPANTTRAFCRTDILTSYVGRVLCLNFCLCLPHSVFSLSLSFQNWHFNQLCWKDSVFKCLCLSVSLSLCHQSLSLSFLSVALSLSLSISHLSSLRLSLPLLSHFYSLFLSLSLLSLCVSPLYLSFLSLCLPLSLSFLSLSISVSLSPSSLSCPEVTLCGWQDIKIQFLPLSLSLTYTQAHSCMCTHKRKNKWCMQMHA